MTSLVVMRNRTAITVVALLVAALAITATSALGAGKTDTVVTIKPARELAAGSISPFDAAGVKAIRRGKPIPAGYRIVARDVSIARGSQAGWGAVRLQCPKGTKTRTLARTGQVGPQLVGKYHSTFVYALVDDGPSVKPGQTASGTVYLVCR
jgi:hypothetical protein